MSVRTIDRSAEFASRVRALLPAAVTAGAMVIEAEAKSKCPVRTGNLRRSIATVVQSANDRAVAFVGPHASYGIYVEYGTRKMSAKPYLRPALDSRRNDAVAAMMNVLRKAVA